MATLPRLIFVLIAALILRGFPFAAEAIAAPKDVVAASTAPAPGSVDCHGATDHETHANAHGHDAQTCKIVCDLGMAAALIPCTASTVSAVPSVRISIARSPTPGVILGPDHPPPIV